MSSLSFLEKRDLEKFFQMSSGYVLDFSDRTFQEFVFDAVGVDIHADKYRFKGPSKANKLRAFWEVETDYDVGLLLSAMEKYADPPSPTGLPTQEMALQRLRCQEIANRLLSADPSFGTAVVQVDVPVPTPPTPDNPRTADIKQTEQSPASPYTTEPVERVYAANEAGNTTEEANAHSQENLVQMAMKAVPVFKWVVGGAGLVALAAIVAKWGANLASLFLIAGVLLVLGMAFLVLNWVSKLKLAHRSLMAVVMGWSLVLMLILSLAFVLSSAAFDKPWRIRTWIDRQIDPDPNRDMHRVIDGGTY